MVINTLAIVLECWKFKGYNEHVEDQKEKLHDDVETVTEFSYLGDRINTGGGCEAAVASRIRLELVKFLECQYLLCIKNSFWRSKEVHTQAV